jgi:hypothetical protein
MHYRNWGKRYIHLENSAFGLRNTSNEILKAKEHYIFTQNLVTNNHMTYVPFLTHRFLTRLIPK